MAWTHLTIDRGDIGVRLDRVLLRHLVHLPGITRNRLQRLIDDGAVLVNGRPASRAAARVAAGDEIAVDLPDRGPRSRPRAEAIALDVIHEDDGLLVVNKPPGQVSHPALRHASGTLLNALLAHAAGRWTPSLVSRLDKDTSGAVLVAKSPGMHARLQQLNGANAIEKDYLAIVAGRPPARGIIDLALDRDPWDRRRVTVRDRGGMPSVTRFTRVASAAVGTDRHVSLLRCRLITGRTHQIRVHLAARGWPVVGDRTYGPRPGAADRSGGLPRMDRQALHAWRLSFTHPVTQERIAALAEIPDDMQAALDASGLALP
jgi:23S rRNA pseudouridine1911/1915/1917 synthase